jgi:hypothetical protein
VNITILSARIAVPYSAACFITAGQGRRGSSLPRRWRPYATRPISRLNSDLRRNSLWLPSLSVDIPRSGTICVGCKA